MSAKTVLITGASRGIGKAVALRFAREGYHVAVSCVRSAALLEDVRAEIEALQKGSSAGVLAFTGDAGSMEDCRELMRRIRERFGRLDVLVNNAGVSYIGLLQDMAESDWDRVLRTNLTSVFNLCRLAVPDMVARKSGKIINISSVWGQTGASCEVAYSASKGAVNAFTKALAKELAPSNIQVNAVACGAIDTEMNQFLTAEERSALEEEIPAGRLGRPGEVAELVCFLARGDAYLTGQIIGLDGGWI